MMENKARQVFVEMNVMKGMMGGGDGGRNTNWVVKECGTNDSTSIGSISEEDSMDSMCSSSSELNEEEAFSSSSTSCSSSSSHSNGPLYELSELMNHLPIKRGLSMFYQGKAQSFTSLERVQSIEDLPKKFITYSKRMKSCKSFGGELDGHRISFSPKATISKKTPRGSFVSLLSKRRNLIGGSTRPSITVHNNS